MSDKKDHMDSLEQFFKKRTEEYDISFREEDWLKLEKKLDVRDAQKAYHKKVRWIAAASILIISLLGYFTYENYNKINQLTQQLNEEIAADSESSEPEDMVTIPSLQNIQPNDAAGEETNTNDENTESRPDVSEDQLSPITVAESNGPENPETLRENMLGNADIGQLQRNHYPIAAQTISTLPEPHLSTPQIAGRAAISSQQGISSPAEFSRSRDESRFSVGFALAPDMSTAGSLSDFHDPGYKLGIQVNYKLTSNLSVSTGAVHSTVRYAAGTGNYNPSIYWTGDIAPEETIAECLILDIPLNLKYNFLNFNNSRFFATAGISSYIMLNEKYEFTYEETYGGYDEELMTQWEDRTGTRHWISNAGISVGYELDVHPNWSLQAEPFLKIPVRDVGWGNVKLYSMGTFVSVNYRI